MSKIEKNFKNEKGELSSMIIESDDNMDVIIELSKNA